MAHSVKYDVLTMINLKKLQTNIKFTLWAIFSKKKGQNQSFSPSVDYRATVDHYYVLKSYFRVINLIAESNLISKSGLRTKIGQFIVEISPLCHHKTSEKNYHYFGPYRTFGIHPVSANREVAL
jgi:hypothetical protein